MKLQHCISVEQFGPQLLSDIFRETDHMVRVLKDGGNFVLRGKVMVTFFYEPSTRTRLSFEAAMNRLGGRVLSTDHASSFSSAAKGEDISDSIRTTASYADIIVLRSAEEGHARVAAEVSVNALTGEPVPVVNAGDGKGEHPTQALLDAYTIRQRFGRLDGLTVALVGDLKHGRTVHSLAKLLAAVHGPGAPGTLLLVAPPAFQMPEDVLACVESRGEGRVRVEMIDFEEAVRRADVLYMTRLQKERFGKTDAAAVPAYRLEARHLGEMKSEAIVLHPLPRNEEIAREVDSDGYRAWYFRQAAYGVPVRMALIRILLGA